MLDFALGYDIFTFLCFFQRNRSLAFAQCVPAGICEVGLGVELLDDPVNLVDIVNMGFVLVKVRHLEVNVKIVPDLVVFVDSQVVELEEGDYAAFNKIHAEIDQFHLYSLQGFDGEGSPQHRVWHVFVYQMESSLLLQDS